LTTSRPKSPRKNAPTHKHKYRLKFHREALEEWYALGNSVRAPLKKALEKRLDHPHVPGGELHPPLNGCYKIKLKKMGVRLVYEVEADVLVVFVLAVDKREDSAAYASAIERIKAMTREIVGAARKAK
jgi:mRNA interferase RelE/StbE